MSTRTACLFMSGWMFAITLEQLWSARFGPAMLSFVLCVALIHVSKHDPHGR